MLREIDGDPVTTQQMLSVWLALDARPDETVTFGIVRDGDHETVELTLGDQPDPS